MNKLVFTFFAFFICTQMILGQVQRVKDFKMPAGISEIEVDKIIVGLDQKLSDYRRAGTLLNPKTHVIDRESVNAFKALFELDAKLYNDMQEYPDDVLYEVEGYTNIARNYFSQDGISFGISDPILESVAVYEDEYVCSVLLTKSTEKFYTSNADVKQESRTFNLEFVFAIRKNNLSVAKIRTIRSGVPIKIAASYTTYLGVDLRGGLQQVGYTVSPKFYEFDVNGNLSVETSIAYQGGFVWYSNFWGASKSSKKNLFATAGINLQYSNIEARLTQDTLPAKKIDDFYLSNGLDIDDVMFQAKEVKVTEKSTLTRLQIPIGISYRLLNKSTSSLLLDINYVPSISILSSSEIGNPSSGKYDLFLKSTKYSFIDADAKPGNDSMSSVYKKIIEEYNGVPGTQKIESNWKLKTNLTHQIGVSLTFFKDFIDDSPTFGIALGLSAIIGLTPTIEPIDLKDGRPLFAGIINGKDLKYPNTGILGSYLQDITLRNFGLRFVIYRKSARKP